MLFRSALYCEHSLLVLNTMNPVCLLLVEIIPVEGILYMVLLSHLVPAEQLLLPPLYLVIVYQ